MTSTAAPSGSTSAARPAYFQSLAEAYRDPRQLLIDLGLPANLAADSGFPTFVPRSYVARMKPGEPGDPLLGQVLPVAAEERAVAGFTFDAVGDAAAQLSPALLQKYEGRALLLVSGACAVHCRYCFRRHFPYDAATEGSSDYAAALELIAADSSLHEIILSGGDPLMATDEKLKRLIVNLESISHLRRLRIHTRLPIVLPDRVTQPLVSLLSSTRFATTVVLHANHAAELVGDCADAISDLRRSRAVLLNQAVLLRSVNDSVKSLAELSERLIELGVLPYYLHQLDRVQGTAHFEVPEAEGRALLKKLHARLPGYLVPRYVREDAGAVGKTPL